MQVNTTVHFYFKDQNVHSIYLDMQAFLTLNHKEYVTGYGKHLARPFAKFILDPCQRAFFAL